MSEIYEKEIVTFEEIKKIEEFEEIELVENFEELKKFFQSESEGQNKILNSPIRKLSYFYKKAK